MSRATGRPLRFHPQPVAKIFAIELMKSVVKKASGRRDPWPSLRDLKSRGLVAPGSTAPTRSASSAGNRSATGPNSCGKGSRSMPDPAEPPRHLLHVFSTFAVGGPQARFVTCSANALKKCASSAIPSLPWTARITRRRRGWTAISTLRSRPCRGRQDPAGSSLANLRHARRNVLRRPPAARSAFDQQLGHDRVVGIADLAASHGCRISMPRTGSAPTKRRCGKIRGASSRGGCCCARVPRARSSSPRITVLYGARRPRLGIGGCQRAASTACRTASIATASRGRPTPR